MSNAMRRAVQILLVCVATWAVPAAAEDFEEIMRDYEKARDAVQKQIAAVKQARQDLKGVEAELNVCRKELEKQEKALEGLEGELEGMEADSADADFLALKRKEVKAQEAAVDRVKRKLYSTIKDWRKLQKLLGADPGGSSLAVKEMKHHAPKRLDPDQEREMQKLMDSYDAALKEHDDLLKALGEEYDGGDRLDDAVDAGESNLQDLEERVHGLSLRFDF